MNISIISHSNCLEHDPGSGHPENPGRLSAILTTLEEASLAKQLTHIEAPSGTQEQVLLAHSLEHFESICNASPESGHLSLDADTIMSPNTLDAALRGVGAACLAVDELMANNTNIIFCATRPPGHHSTHDQAMGFCFFNNAAIAALYAKKVFHLARVAIVDFDVHHGNGTQDIVSGKEGVLYISTHQSPLYPGSGSIAENIPGNILNVPLESGTSHAIYQSIFNENVLPALRGFKPELLIVSAGFDAHRDDPLANLAFTEETYHWLGTQLKQVADEYCQSKLLAVLEGGYNLEVLGSSVESFLEGLLEGSAE